MEVGCMRDFGVKSYLHNFYHRQGHSESNRDGQADKCLISSGARRFSSRWWKYLLWLGSSLVLLGFCLLVIAFALPRKAIDVNADSPSSPSSVIIIDRQALNYNAHLDASRLLGIAFVVGGGIFFAFALLLPTFCHVWCASGDATDETDPLKFTMETQNDDASLPMGKVIKSVQPSSRK